MAQFIDTIKDDPVDLRAFGIRNKDVISVLQDLRELYVSD
jgi:hypothetical protein